MIVLSLTKPELNDLQDALAITQSFVEYIKENYSIFEEAGGIVWKDGNPIPLDELIKKNINLLQSLL